MGISLSKGQKISLTKEAGASLTRIIMGLGWDAVKSKGGFLGGIFGGGGESIDLDASCLMFDDGGNLIDVVWFRQLHSKDGSIQHSGDNRTGEGEGDDEQIQVNLNAVPATVKNLIFTVNNFTGQNFANVENAYCRLVNADNNSEIARYNLSCQGEHSAMIMAKVYRHNGEWKMHAIGDVGHGRTAGELLPQLSPLL
ncbi:Tellurium resistance protein terZ [Chromatium okenii]|uniref:TerD family protein n=1 Tax=Chromatium okenii TaxID=61644 RepID=UPI001905E36B|nr:TerD family protein [Chromatium okenii]MBK1641889.1 Tellurium resistance protein terZ [Chromatium okenii]